MKNRIALITGASGGIGAEFAHQLAFLKYDLMLTGRNEERLLRLSKKLEKFYHINVDFIISDFSESRSLNLFLAKLKEIENIEILINNAGFGAAESFIRAADEDTEKMLMVHIDAVTRITHAVIPQMIERRSGTIINVSSLAAFSPHPENLLYSTTKAYIIAFSECLHMSLKKYNINVQALCPGFTKTAFHDKLLKKGEKLKSNKFIYWMQPETIVTKSLAVAKVNSSVVYVPGFYNKLLFYMLKYTPRSLYYSVADKLIIDS